MTQDVELNGDLSKYAPKRTEAQIDADDAVIEHYTVQGWTIRKIAAKLSEMRDYTLSYQTILVRQKQIREEWKAEAQRDLSEYIASELRGLKEQEDELWRAWHRSQQDAVTETDEHGTSPGENGGEWSKKAMKREGQVGGVQFMNAILEIRRQRAALLGLDAPQKQGGIGISGGVTFIQLNHIDPAKVLGLPTDNSNGNSTK